MIVRKNLLLLILISLAVTLACSVSFQGLPAVTETPVPRTATSMTVVVATAVLTEVPTTPTPLFTFTPVPETVALDFAAQLCNAKWLNGGQKFEACPGLNSDLSTGYASLLDPMSEGLPANTPVILTVPAWNGFAALFLRYPEVKVQANDHFSATLRCQNSATSCDVAFGLDYYDSNGIYHSPLVAWNYKTGEAPLAVDFDLSALTGQNVEFVLAMRPNNDTPQQDLALWINPKIYRPNP